MSTFYARSGPLDTYALEGEPLPEAGAALGLLLPVFCACACAAAGFEADVDLFERGDVAALAVWATEAGAAGAMTDGLS